MSRRYVQNGHPPALLSDHLPEDLSLAITGIDRAELVRSFVLNDEIENPVLARILARHERGPGWGGHGGTVERNCPLMPSAIIALR